MKELYATLMAEDAKLREMTSAAETQKRLVEQLKSDFMVHMDKIGTSTFNGDVGRISVVETEVPTVDDWDQLYDFIMQDPENFDILQRRISTNAVRQRMNDGVEVPGTSKFVRKSLSITRGR